MSLMSFHARFAVLPLCLAATLTAADTAAGLPKESPFKLRGGPAAPVATANETIEFAGVSSIGKKTDLIFYDKTAKKSHWIAQGETKEGISVVKYDERREEAVVKINGVEKTLALRKASGPSGTARPIPPAPAGFNTPVPAPMPVTAATPLPAQTTLPAQVEPAVPASPLPAPAPVAAQPATPAEMQAKQETEARMLVSDLLEIGMAQRRAYEEAQRKAAEGNSSNAVNPAVPNPTQVVPAQPQPQTPQ